MGNSFSSDRLPWPMNILFVKRLRICLVILILFWALQPTAKADPVLVRSVAGTIHGFLELRSEDGQVVASGDSFQVVDRLWEVSDLVALWESYERGMERAA
jgi:hypothetical protein